LAGSAANDAVITVATTNAPMRFFTKNLLSQSKWL
jgi:hypothetical protein